MLWEYNDRFTDSSDALSEAIINLRYRQAQLLIESGCDVNARDSCMRTPLIVVSICLTGVDNWYNREKFGKLLLDNSANQNLCDSFGLTPLIHAAINGQPDYVKVLLSYERTDYSLCDKAGNNAIMLAARYGQVQVLRQFYDHIITNETITDGFIDYRNSDNKSALDLAYEGSHYECVALLQSLKRELSPRRELGLNEAPNAPNTPNTLSNNTNFINDGFRANNSLAIQLSENDCLLKSQTKSVDNLSKSNGRSVKNGIKLPPINGKRFVEYSEWNQNNSKDINVSNDRKTI